MGISKSKINKLKFDSFSSDKEPLFFYSQFLNLNKDKKITQDIEEYFNV